MKNFNPETNETQSSCMLCDVELSCCSKRKYVPTAMNLISFEPGSSFLNVSITIPEELVTVTEFVSVENAQGDEYFDLTF